MEIHKFWDVHWVDLIGRNRIHWFLSQNLRKLILASTQILQNRIFKDLHGFWGLGWSFLPSKPIPWDRSHLEASVGGPISSQSSTKYRNVPKMTCGPRLRPYTIHRLVEGSAFNNPNQELYSRCQSLAKRAFSRLAEISDMLLTELIKQHQWLLGWAFYLGTLEPEHDFMMKWISHTQNPKLGSHEKT